MKDFFLLGVSKYKEGAAFYRLPNKLHLLTHNGSNEEKNRNVSLTHSSNE